MLLAIVVDGGTGNNNVVNRDDGFGDDGGSDDDSTAPASRDLIVQCRQQTSASCHNTFRSVTEAHTTCCVIRQVGLMISSIRS